MAKLLVVDDDPINLEAVRCLLSGRGYALDLASSGEEAIEKVSANPYGYALAILDFRMGAKNGAETARDILSISKHLYVLIHSGDESRDALQSAWEAGAVKFIEKSKGAEAFAEAVDHWYQQYQEKLQPLVPAATPAEQEAWIRSIGMIGRSDALVNIARRIKKLGEEKSELSVLILGENGSGKELVARAIHQFSPRANGPFVAIDAGSLPENLVESELFGHEKGAFTGAEQRRVGSFQFADRGTLFLDEIGNTSLAVQAKLLRVLQNKMIRPVGSNREIKVDVRIVAATNLDLKNAIREGKFREDLYYRLRGITIALPPLRDRIEDIEPLVHAICGKYNAERKSKKEFLLKSVKYLEKHRWPGNVRELENTVLELLTESYSDKISLEEVKEKLSLDDEPSFGDRPPELKSYVDDMTRQYVISLLKSSRSKLEAAQKAGMAETTFRDLLKRLGLNKTNFSEGAERE